MQGEVQLVARSQVPLEQTWNRESVFADDAAWEQAYQQASAQATALGAYAGRLAEGPAVLVECMEASMALQQMMNRLWIYASIAQSVDAADSAANAMYGRIGALIGQVMAAVAFIEPELIAIGSAQLNAWAAQSPAVAVYAHSFDDLFRRQAHVRSAEVEELLGLMADPFTQVDSTYEMLTTAEIPFAPAQSTAGETRTVAQSAIDDLLRSPDRELRRTAWQHYADGYLSVRETLASNYAVAIRRAATLARARRYPSALEASLHENNIPPAVVHSLLSTFQKNLPTWHRYWAVRRKALRLSTLYPYDIWAPITQAEPDVSYEQAVEWIATGLRPLGEDYVEALRRGCLEQRWVDRAANLGKRQGAFSSGTKGTHPFIMMSWSDSLKSMSTLAHELGHSLHSYMTWQKQPFVYSGYSLFVAEVASNFNQAMTRAHLLATHTDPAFQIAVIEEAMDNFHRYFFIMPTLARFEMEMHERIERGEGLTAVEMNARMLALYSEGYGAELDPDGERTGITWAQFPHLYSNFYVYQYATGISAAHALSEAILAGAPGAAERYRTFLSLGSSVYPLDALRQAGVDMTGPQAVEQTFAVLARYVDRLEALVG